MTTNDEQLEDKLADKYRHLLSSKLAMLDELRSFGNDRFFIGAERWDGTYDVFNQCVGDEVDMQAYEIANQELQVYFNKVRNYKIGFR